MQDEVKELAEKYDQEAFDLASSISGRYLAANGKLKEPGVAVISEVGMKIFFEVKKLIANALARVALEYVEERRKKTTHTVTRVTAGFFPGGAEGILEESWEEEEE